MKKILIFISFVIVLFFIYLNTAYKMPDCGNSNPIFDEHLPESIEYRNELRAQLEKVDKANLKFWVYKLVKINNENYFKVYVQSENLCAILFARNLSGKMKLSKKFKNNEINESFKGTPLLDVELDIELRNNETYFTITKIGSIPDL